jgi:beta-alanine--pyruvate transaminase
MTTARKFEPHPNNLEAYWMPFTANRQFKANPRMFVAAKDMYYTTLDGKQVLDGFAGMWCVNAGHGRDRIVEAIKAQAETMDYVTAFNMGHPGAFELASRIAQLAPGDLDHVFFTNSGSEAVDTALKIAIAYHHARGEPGRTRLIGRERGYHGVGFGGISVGGISANRKAFGPLLSGVDHMRHTHDPARNGYAKGQPEHGAELADDLERIAALHDPSTIAAVIVEPMAGSTGVLPPPKGYLERLRAICDKHGFLLIFDEVITGFGRLGASFAAEKFGVTPDLMTFAKGITNAAVPMGGVVAKKQIYDAFMKGPEWMVELFHGYTYSAHPLACAAGLATLDLYRDEGLFERAAKIMPHFEQAVHSLKGFPNVIDIRNLGLAGAVELSPRPGQPGKRAFDVFLKCLEKGVMFRVTGDTVALSPALIATEAQLDQMVSTLGEVLKTMD